jgi:FkbM family methyltransferase
MKSLKGFLRRKYVERRLDQPPFVVKSPVIGHQIAFLVHTSFEYYNRAQDSYSGEPDMVKWLAENLTTSDVLWDIGANVGAYSLLAAKVCPAAQVVAFEPFIPSFAHLWENMMLNECVERITPLCLALSDHTGIDNLAVKDSRAGSSQHQLGENPKGLTQKVISWSGDEAIADLFLPSPTLVKVDTDGHEIQVLKGMRETLRNPSLRSAMVEVEEGKTETKIAALLQDAGLKRVDNPFTQPTNGVFNALFIRN